MYFRAEQINDFYRILGERMSQFKVKKCEPGSWMAEKLCPSREFPWVATRRGISMNDFTEVARQLLNIICSRVSPCTHMNSILDIRA